MVANDLVDDEAQELFRKIGIEIRFFGKLTKDMLGLDYTNRNQPYAVVNLAPSL